VACRQRIEVVAIAHVAIDARQARAI